MAIAFSILTIICIGLLIYGLIKPEKLLTSPHNSRRKVAQVYGSASFLFFCAFIIAVPKNEGAASTGNNDSNEILATKTEIAAPKEKTKLDLLVEKKLAFLPGTYAQGTIPKGEYIFVSERGGYYAEERDGEILDNENFDSFGYVYNHAIGDITTHRLLISEGALVELGASGAKDIYMRLTKKSEYNFSGHYKVGSDIQPGRYIVESAGEAYMEVNHGPIGNGEIINNDNFKGTKSVTLRDGQYLKLNRASISIRSNE